MDSNQANNETCTLGDDSCKTGACAKGACKPCAISMLVMVGGLLGLVAKIFF